MLWRRWHLQWVIALVNLLGEWLASCKLQISTPTSTLGPWESLPTWKSYAFKPTLSLLDDQTINVKINDDEEIFYEDWVQLYEILYDKGVKLSYKCCSNKFLSWNKEKNDLLGAWS